MNCFEWVTVKFRLHNEEDSVCEKMGILSWSAGFLWGSGDQTLMLSLKCTVGNSFVTVDISFVEDIGLRKVHILELPHLLNPCR